MKREELIGKNDFGLFPAEQAEAFVAKDRETLRGNTVIDIPEEPLTTPDGVRWLHTKKVPIADEDGNPEYLLGISSSPLATCSSTSRHTSPSWSRSARCTSAM